MNQQVVITGGAGFIGSHLAKRFDNPIIVDHKVGVSLENFLDDNAVPEYATVYHLASHPNQAAVRSDPINAVHNIVANTLNLAELCKKKNAKLIYVSSSMIYGDWSGFIREDCNPNPKNQYGILKLCAERLVIRALEGRHFAIIRPIAVYGPGDSGDRVITKWIKSALKNEPLFINNPTEKLEFTYVEDLVDALVAAKDGFGIYNISGGSLISLNAATQIILQRTRSKSTIEYLTPHADMPVRGSLNLSRAKQFLNYQPKFDFIEGVDETIASLV